MAETVTQQALPGEYAANIDRGSRQALLRATDSAAASSQTLGAERMASDVAERKKYHGGVSSGKLSNDTGR